MSNSMSWYMRFIGLAFLVAASSSASAQVNASFMVNYQAPSCSPTVVSFANTSTGAGPLSYEWNFGIVAGVNSTQQNPSTMYLQCGTFTVSLKVTNGAGQSHTATQQVTIDCQPEANFTVSQSTGCLPITVTFNSGGVVNAGAPIISYQWDFGDGYGSTSPNPTHSYNTAGCKSVTLVVTNANGCTDDTTIVNAVCPSPAPVADFTSTSPVGCAYPFNVSYTANVAGANPPFTYQWTFQGGSPSTSTATNPTITYNAAGSNWSQLVVTDATGCKDTIKKFNYVVVATTATNFTVNSANGCAPFTLIAQAQNTQFASSTTWTTTGGMMASTNAPDNAVYFANPGSYQVCLTMTFPGNCQATKCTTVVVNPSPVADFAETGISPTCQPPLTVSYTDASIGSGLTYQWLLPGAAFPSSTQASPSNVPYNVCGNFDATLVVTNGFGCTDTLTKPSLVDIDCPMASFASSSVMGCYPLDVTFNSSQSTGTPTQWFWNFGDAGNPNAVQSSLENPSHTYVTGGCYAVRLIIVNAQGCRDTTVVNNMVCVGTPPALNFSANPLIACAGVPIAFTNTSTVTPWNTYKWDFLSPDPFNTMSTAKNPTYTYQDTGVFDVTLISCHSGCCDTLTIPNLISIKPPVAKIEVVRSCADPFTVTLHGETSLGATSYSWSVPGGTPATSGDPVLVCHFANTGTYTATLTVFNAQTGCSHTATKTIQIKNVQADFYMADTAACSPHLFCFMNTSQDGYTYKWSGINQAGTLIWTSNVANPCVTWTTPGIYSIRLIAYDVNGCADTIFKPNAFRVFGLGTVFYATSTGGCAPATTAFQITVLPSVTSTQAVSYQWTFGDPGSGANNYASTLSATHTYVNAGLYSVVFTVTDEHGCVTSRSFPDYVSVFKPDAQFSALDSIVCVGTPVCFTNASAGSQPVTYSWDFGDGSPGSIALNPCHQYSDTGYYTVRLFATDNAGCKDTMVKPMFVHIISPQALFTADTTESTCPPLAVTFANQSTGTDPGTTYHWNFGDGAVSTAQNPYHIYTYPGDFDVTLVMTSADGCKDTLVMNDFIQVHGPVADIEVTPEQGCTPLQVCFNTLSGSSLFYTWDFGDGTVTTGNDSICHIYTQDAVYLPQVILNDGAGCVYSLPLDTVSSLVPEASFTASTYFLCQNGSVQFTNTTTSESNLVQYL
ncbi:MAG TPA: PKD domain-containing protein, partial [Chitinophagales bacterium]|nr:PKD domain-containing protein [Chitinophagales bacterium]